MKIFEKWSKIRKAHKGFYNDGTPKEGIISRYLNRPISSLISASLLDTKITPNQISVITFFLSFLCIPLYLFGNFIAGGIMIQILSIVDGVDGELARVKKMSSKFGEIIDGLLDRGVEIIISFSIAFGVWIMTNSIFPWIFFAIAVTGFLVSNYFGELMGAKIKEDKVRAKSESKTVKTLKFKPARDVILFTIAILSLLKRPELGLLFAGIISWIYFFTRVYFALPMLRKY